MTSIQRSLARKALGLAKRFGDKGLARRGSRFAKLFGGKRIDVRMLRANPNMSRRAFMKMGLATTAGALNNVAQNSRAARGIYSKNGLNLLKLATRKRNSRLTRMVLGGAGQLFGAFGG